MPKQVIVNQIPENAEDETKIVGHFDGEFNCESLGKLCSLLLDGEPVFILRAKDILALAQVKEYAAKLREKNTKNFDRTNRAIKSMIDWRNTHREKVRLPD